MLAWRVCLLVCIDEHDRPVHCCCRQVWSCTLYSVRSQVETVWQRDTGMFTYNLYLSALTLALAAGKVSCPVENRVMRCWHGYLSGVRCK